MEMALNENDFVEIEYTGRLKDEDEVFDTTYEDVAKDNGLYNEDYAYGPVIIQIGKKHLLEGLDKHLVGKEPGEYSFEIKPEEAFGRKSAKLLRLIPAKLFKRDQVAPVPGLKVTIDDQRGTVRSVSGGRIIVDFNHPLSSKTLKYEVKVNRKVTDPAEQVKALIRITLNLPDSDVEVHEEEAVIKEGIPEELQEHFRKLILDSVISIKKVTFAGTGQAKSLNT